MNTEKHLKLSCLRFYMEIQEAIEGVEKTTTTEDPNTSP